MYYITVKQSPSYHQMTLEEFLFGDDTKSDDSNLMINNNETNTRTYKASRVSKVFRDKVDIAHLVNELEVFNEQTKELRERPRHELYSEFYIPKKTGGLRRIDAPDIELKSALRNLKAIFEDDFKALYHTSAFAYIKGRSTIDCVKKHQSNESKWFGKYDLHGLFPSTTLDWVMDMFSMVFPFCLVVETERGKEALRTALSLAFLDGGLPQGTPVSPMITNVMMIPVDFELANTLRDFNHQRFIYTRYADDFIISSKYTFDYKEIEKLIMDTLGEFGAPFRINEKKTRYGSSSGRNFNLGLMLNNENKITVGYKKKRQFQAMLSSFVLDTKNGNLWPIEDVQRLEGFRSYYKMVEGEAIDGIVNHIGEKYEVNIPEMIKEQLSV